MNRLFGHGIKRLGALIEPSLYPSSFDVVINCGYEIGRYAVSVQTDKTIKIKWLPSAGVVQW